MHGMKFDWSVKVVFCLPRDCATLFNIIIYNKMAALQMKKIKNINRRLNDVARVDKSKYVALPSDLTAFANN